MSKGLKTRAMNVICVLALAITLNSYGNGAALADEDPTSSNPEQPSMGEFITRNPKCPEITDSCSVCKIENGIANCSLPKIACIKKEWICTPNGNVDSKPAPK